jgi:diphthine-ammonia ligase
VLRSLIQHNIINMSDLLTAFFQLIACLCAVKAVSSGAILSNYQRKRVEYVCEELGLGEYPHPLIHHFFFLLFLSSLLLRLVSLAYLWQRDQKELLLEMIENDVEAVVIKVFP